MPQLGWLIDLDKCTGCDSCSIACKSENNTRPLSSSMPFKKGRGVLPDHVSYRWVVKKEGGVYIVLKKITLAEAVGTQLAHVITEIRPSEFKGPAFRQGHTVCNAVTPVVRLEKAVRSAVIDHRFANCRTDSHWITKLDYSKMA